MVALLVPIVWLGVYPETALAKIRPAVDRRAPRHGDAQRRARRTPAATAARACRLRLAAALPEEARR